MNLILRQELIIQTFTLIIETFISIVDNIDIIQLFLDSRSPEIEK